MALEKGMIKPFEDRQVRKGMISYGVSSYGYDLRISDEFKIFTNINNTIVDPKGFDPRSFVDYQGDVCIIPPNSFALGRSVEYFKIPRNVLTICVGKSTYARCGIITNVTPFEPEWEGYVTLEISNTTPLPAKIYANEGIAQVLFFQSDEACQTSYADRQGKYQGQQGIVLPTVQAPARHPNQGPGGEWSWRNRRRKRRGPPSPTRVTRDAVPMPRSPRRGRRSRSIWTPSWTRSTISSRRTPRSS